jgi:hypothetical protein
MISIPPRPFDTSEEADRIQFDAFRNMSEEQRQQRAAELIRSCRELQEQGVRVRHPDYSDEEVRIAAIRMRLGEELFERAYAEFLHIVP